MVIDEKVIEFARFVGKFDAVEKFMQEVVWKTYLRQLKEIDETLLAADSVRVDCAANGKTDLPYFNACCEELKTTGYLHYRKRPANCILFVCTAFAFEFSSFSDGPAVLGV